MFGASILWDFVVLLFFYCCFFFLFTGCWLESSVRVCSFFREVFVLFSFVWIILCICLERAFCCFAVVVFVVSSFFLLVVGWSGL